MRGYPQLISNFGLLSWQRPIPGRQPALIASERMVDMEQISRSPQRYPGRPRTVRGLRYFYDMPRNVSVPGFSLRHSLLR
jgi:hypothetical protein